MLFIQNPQINGSSSKLISACITPAVFEQHHIFLNLFNLHVVEYNNTEISTTQLSELVIKIM